MNSQPPIFNLSEKIRRIPTQRCWFSANTTPNKAITGWIVGAYMNGKPDSKYPCVAFHIITDDNKKLTLDVKMVRTKEEFMRTK